MATSQFASVCADRLDPDEGLDFVLPLSPILGAGETIDSFELVVRPEGALLGLKILGDADGYPYADPAVIEDGKSIQLWLGIDPAYRANPAFDNQGTALPFEVFLITSEGRPRNRTFKVQVPQL